MRRALAGALVIACAVATRDSGATRPLPDYRYFRALSIDLVGRAPTRDEVDAIEQPSFDFAAWIDAHLDGPAYAERLRTIYMDRLRLALPSTVTFEPAALRLVQTTIAGPDGTPLTVYFRYGQRRASPDIDGQLCFSEAEIGVKVPGEGPVIGTPRPVDRKLLEARTVLVKPWWLYADYRDRDPRDRYDAASWKTRFPGYELYEPLFVDPGTKAPTTTVRVCREEAQTATTGHVFTTGRVAGDKKAPLPPGRLTRLPLDTPYATRHANEVVSCLSQTGFTSTLDCGCGVGLERCMPTGPNGFLQPQVAPLGIDRPFLVSPRPPRLWLQTWWTEEAVRFMDRVFADNRDLRELLTDTGTMVNGPLAQFYRGFASQTCCTNATELDYVDAEPLFDPAQVPPLVPAQVDTWVRVEDRGPHAAGVMTMPVFLLKYGTRRQRAHAIYNAFLCKDFVAEHLKLEPSTEPDLTKRPGCQTCHIKLEPLAAFFARIQENDWSYLPADKFPVESTRCAAADPTRVGGACKTFYDPAFTDATRARLRGTYAAPDHAEAGPPGFAEEVTRSPDFVACTVSTIAESFLGRPLGPGDATWRARLAEDFVAGGYRARDLVRAIVMSPQYRELDDTRRRTP